MAILAADNLCKYLCMRSVKTAQRQEIASSEFPQL
jgi:hypothetical protein